MITHWFELWSKPRIQLSIGDELFMGVGCLFLLACGSTLYFGTIWFYDFLNRRARAKQRSAREAAKK